MLNYVWFVLVSIGIVFAISIDIYEKGNNKYKNNENIEIFIENYQQFESSEKNSSTLKSKIQKEDFNKFYNQKHKEDLVFNILLTKTNKKDSLVAFVKISDSFPNILKTMAGVSGKEDDLTGIIHVTNVNNSPKFNLKFESISFVKMKQVTNSALDYAGIAVEIALGLIGIMALWLGIMKIAEESGLIKIIANAVKPITKFLFPEVPSDHPAMGSMIMNISANMLGLGNAATPFGLKAMEELETLNKNKGTASNAMCTFLAVNTAGLTLIPATAIAVRAASGSMNPALIIGTSMFGALCATVTGIAATKILEKFTSVKETNSESSKSPLPIKTLFLIFGLIIIIIGMSYFGVMQALFGWISIDILKDLIQIISTIAIPLIIIVFVGYGIIKKVKVYETFVEGAKEGFNVAIKIIPYLVAMLVGIGIFRAGGGMDLLIYILEPIAELINMPSEALPMALMRPLSGSGSLGIMTEIISVHGADSFLGILVSTFFGSTETTFYVLAVYFGSINIKNTRHALPAGLLADIAGILGAVFIVNQMFG